MFSSQALKKVRLAGENYIFVRAQDEDEEVEVIEIDEYAEKLQAVLSKYNIEYLSNEYKANKTEEGALVEQELMSNELGNIKTKVIGDFKKDKLANLYWDFCNTFLAATSKKEKAELLETIAGLMDPAIEKNTSKISVKPADIYEKYNIVLDKMDEIVHERDLPKVAEATTREELGKIFEELDKDKVLSRSVSMPIYRFFADHTDEQLIEVGGLDFRSLMEDLKKSTQQIRVKPTANLIQKLVEQLTAHEKFSGQARFVGFSRDGKSVFYFASPFKQPFELVADRQAGDNLDFVNLSIKLCEVRFIAKSVDKAKELITHVVSLAVAQQQGSDVAEAEEKEDKNVYQSWSRNRLLEEMDDGLVVNLEQGGFEIYYRNKPISVYKNIEEAKEAGADTSQRNFLLPDDQSPIILWGAGTVTRIESKRVASKIVSTIAELKDLDYFFRHKGQFVEIYVITADGESAKSVATRKIGERFTLR